MKKGFVNHIFNMQINVLYCYCTRKHEQVPTYV